MFLVFVNQINVVNCYFSLDCTNVSNGSAKKVNSVFLEKFHIFVHRIVEWYVRYYVCNDCS